MVGESQDKLNKSCTRRCSICESQRPQICQSSCRERWCGRQCELFSFAIRWFQPGDRLAVQNLRPTSRLQQHVRILAKIHPNALSRQARMRNLESNKLGRWKTGTIALKGSYAVDRSCILEQEVLHLFDFPVTISGVAVPLGCALLRHQDLRKHAARFNGGLHLWLQFRVVHTSHFNPSATIIQAIYCPTLAL